VSHFKHVCRSYPVEKPPGSSLTVAVVGEGERGAVCRRPGYAGGEGQAGRRWGGGGSPQGSLAPCVLSGIVKSHLFVIIARSAKWSQAPHFVGMHRYDEMR